MDHRTGQQPLPSPALTPPASQAPRASRSLVFRRSLRLMLRRLVYVFTLAARPLRRYVGLLAVTAVLLGVIGWMAYQLWAPTTTAQQDTRVALLPPSQAVENYIKGQQNYNAELMWTSLSPASQANQLSNGASKQLLQSRVDTKRDSGLRFNNYDYIGGTSLDEGGSLFFYAVDVQRGNQRAKLPMTFLVDNDGMVADIISPPLLTDLSIPTSN